MALHGSPRAVTAHALRRAALKPQALRRAALKPQALRRAALVAAAVCMVGCAVAPTAPVAEAPGRVSAERLQRLDRFMQAATTPPMSGATPAADTTYLGAVTLVMRHGQVLNLAAHGHQDLARRAPMAIDSIFRIYSMSKTVASVAAMLLVEEGRLSLDAPISRWLPEFERPSVLVAGSADAPVLRPAATPITVQHLLTHTAGFATGGDDIAQASLLLERAQPHGAADLREFAARVARAPLAADPGQRFRYDGVQIEVLGRLIEVASGQPLERFVQTRIFDPLRMGDTGFAVPAAQRHRVVDITRMGPQGRLVLADGPSAATPGAALNRYASGAGGLYSTAGDFARLCQMLLGQGTLEGVTLLGRKSVQLMMSNQLTRLPPQPGLPAGRFSAAEGFGLGGSVLLDVGARGRLGSVGAYGWSGAASTYFTIDRREGLIAILLMQHLPTSRGPDQSPDLPKLATPFYNLVYQALLP